MLYEKQNIHYFANRFFIVFFSDLKSEASGKVSRKRLKKDAVPDALVDIVTKKRQKLINQKKGLPIYIHITSNIHLLLSAKNKGKWTFNTPKMLFCFYSVLI